MPESLLSTSKEEGAFTSQCPAKTANNHFLSRSQSVTYSICHLFKELKCVFASIEAQK